MTARRRFTAVASCLAVAMFLASRAEAQSSLQVPIQFDFLNPGARSLALGSAFVGLADDATSAFVNPAGLPQLIGREFSVEGRFKRQQQPFLVGGRLSGDPTGQEIDTIRGPQFRDITDSGNALGFASFVYAGRRAAFAAYRHELIRLDQTFTSTGVFQNHGFENRDTGFTGTRTIAIDNYGLSAGFRLTPVVSVGAGLSVYTFSLGFDFNRYVAETFYGTPDPKLNLFHFTQHGDTAGVGGSVGVLISRTTRLKFGAAFKRGPRFDYSSFSGGLVGTQKTTEAEFKVPDVASAGVVFRPTDALMFTTEYDRVLHSQLRSDYVNVLVAQGESASRADHFSIHDSNEIHVGGEYVFTALRALPSVRAGVWYDPDHSVHYTPTSANDLLDERIAAALSSGKDLWHYTFGFGLPASTHLEFNAGGDVTSRSHLFSTSAIVRF